LQGWGEPKLTDVLDLKTMDMLTSTPRDLFAWDAPGAGPTPFDAAGDTPWFFRFDVDSSAEALRVTLAWTDEPGSTGTGKQLVNDLDLALRPPGSAGFDYLGNVMNTTTGQSIQGGTRDSLNNVECLRLSSPPTGTWTARVRPTEGSFDDPQGFALVATGLLSAESFFRSASLGLAQTPGFAQPATSQAGEDGEIPLVLVGAFTLQADGEDVTASSLALTLSDPAIADFGPIQLWPDADGNGELDEPATALATAVVAATTATFGSFPSLADGVSASYVVTIGSPIVAAVPAASPAFALGGFVASPFGNALAAAAALVALLLLARRATRVSAGERRSGVSRAACTACTAAALLACATWVAPSCGGGGGGGGAPSYSLTLSAAGFDFTGDDSLEPIAPENAIELEFAVEPFVAP
jgi:hypothetical protein